MCFLMFRYRLNAWHSTPRDQISSSAYGFFVFPESLKLYTYHMLYTGSDFLADIGGYLGLFLGLSVFGVVDILAKVFGDCSCCGKDKDDGGDGHRDEEEWAKSANVTLLKYVTEEGENNRDIVRFGGGGGGGSGGSSRRNTLSTTT